MRRANASSCHAFRLRRSAALVALLAGLIAPPTLRADAAGDPAADPKVAALAASLRAAMGKAEQRATAAAFPRKNILAAVSRSMWETFYHGAYTSGEEASAVDIVAADAATPILKEAATRMKYELLLN